MSQDKNLTQARVAELKITGKKYCMSCSTYMPEKGGVFVIKKRKGNQHKSWRCNICVKARKKGVNPELVSLKE